MTVHVRLPVWRVIGPMRQKDGRTRVEEQYVSAPVAPETPDGGSVVPVPRLPRAFERWTGSGFVLDTETRDAATEEARLATLSLRERQVEAVAAAVAAVGAALAEAGIGGPALEKALQARERRP